MKRIFILTLFLFSLSLVACSEDGSDSKTDDSNLNEETTTLTISAAVSLTDALEEIKEIYEKNHQVELTFNLGGSGTLAQQIEQGAPADLFISANQDWMDTLEEKDEIIGDTRVDVTGNKLVLITGESSDISYQSLDEIALDELDKVAIGNPESVPAGAYTEDTLKSIGIWDDLDEKAIFAKDVRQVLTYVESGNADIGFVYESDARSSDEIEILATAEEDDHDPIIYPMAIVTDTAHEELTQEFADFLETDEAQEILENHGFTK